MAKTSVTSRFLLSQLVMDKEGNWRMKLNVTDVLSQLFRDYSVKLSLNRKIFLQEIKDLQARVRDAQNNKSLFDNKENEDLPTDLRIATKALEKAREKFKAAKKRCVSIVFIATVFAIRYPDGTTGMTTELVLEVPSETVNEVNAVRKDLEFYQVQLTALKKKPVKKKPVKAEIKKEPKQ